MSGASSKDEIVDHIIQIIQTHSDPQPLLREIAQAVGEYLASDGCFIISGMANRTTSHVSYWNRSYEPQMLPESLKTFLIDLDIKNQAQDNWLIIIHNLQDLPLNPFPSWKSLLISRLIFRGNVNGFILLGYRDYHKWKKQELNQLNQLRDILSIACFVTQPQQVSSVLMQSLLRKWYKETQEQITSEKNLVDLQEQMITMLSDRIRNPLAAIKMAAQLLEHSDKPEEKYWTALKQAYSQIEQLVKSISTLRNIQTQELTIHLELINLETFLYDIVKKCQLLWQSDIRKRLKLLLEIEPTCNPILLYTDSQHLKVIFFELLTNASNFSTPQSTVYLRASKDNNQIKIEITNQGLEISAEDMDYIFEPFRRGTEAIKKFIPGVGIGLTLVKGLVDCLGGRIEVNSHPLNSDELYLTSFILSFPQ